MARFAEVNPATGKTWKCVELFEALSEAEIQLKELKAIANHESALTFSDVYERWFLPALATDSKERPAFWSDARCGLKTVANWMQETAEELRKPVLIK